MARGNPPTLVGGGLVAYLPLEFGGMPKTTKEAHAKDLMEKYGDKPRQYRNGMGLAIPAADQIEILRRAVRYFMATEQVKTKAKQYNLTDEQKTQLRERESTEKAAAESAFMKLYVEVWLPRVEAGAITIESVAVGGRPLQTTLNDKKEAAIHERVMELLAVVQRIVHSSVTPSKVVELFGLGQGTPPRAGIKAAEIVDGFYSFLGFTRLLTSDVIRKAVVRGVRECVFAYANGPTPTLGPDRKYQVVADKVRFETDLAEDEIDLETGFIMMPGAMPRSEPIPETPVGKKAEGETGTTPSGAGADAKAEGGPAGEPPKAGPGAAKSVELSFSADRNQLYTAWNAAANLADMAGRIKVTIRADSESGFDQSKLQNGVIEPLREADLIE